MSYYDSENDNRRVEIEDRRFWLEKIERAFIRNQERLDQDNQKSLNFIKDKLMKNGLFFKGLTKQEAENSDFSRYWMDYDGVKYFDGNPNMNFYMDHIKAVHFKERQKRLNDIKTLLISQGTGVIYLSGNDIVFLEDWSR
jgi:hypothetical protein